MTVKFFLGTTEVVVNSEPEIPLEEIVEAKQILLERWHALGSEFKRRVYDIPSDLRFELVELLRDTFV